MMKYIKIEIDKRHSTLEREINDFLNEKEVDTDCVITYSLANESDEHLHVISFGNMLATLDIINWWFSVPLIQTKGANALLIYGYTPISEVIMTRGVM